MPNELVPLSPAAGNRNKADKKLGDKLSGKLGEAILDVVLQVPASQQTRRDDSQATANALARAAAKQAALLSGSMALPPGFFGWLTLVPELVGVWKVQAQMVSDIAAIYGKSAALGREQMIYCLFRHVSAQLFRDVAVRVGERVVMRGASLGLLQTIARTLGVKVTQKVLGKGLARFVPLIGAAGVGAYAYFDTLQVAKTAVELFSSEITLEAGEV